VRRRVACDRHCQCLAGGPDHLVVIWWS
jgi:hypothetical protein